MNLPALSFRFRPGRKPGALGLLLSFSLILVWAVTAYAQEDAKHASSQGIAPPAGTADTEPAGTVVPTTQVIRSPLIEKMHKARKAGDMKTVRKLQSLLPVPEKAKTGESAGETVLIPSKTFSGAGDPAKTNGKDPQKENLSGPQITGFGADVKVRTSNPSTMEFNQAMASDSAGNLYVAWQDDLFTTGDYIQVYMSSDGGATWSAMGYVRNTSADLKEPSLAVGEGSNGDTLLLAYIMDDGSGLPVPEVATTPLGTNSFSIHSVPIWTSWDGYAKPSICTDAINYSGWYAYLTCEGIYDAGTDNINGCSFRSQDGGVTWIDEQVPFGDFDTYPWRDTENAFGTTLDRVFLVTFNDYDDTLYVATSDDYAFTWNKVINIVRVTIGIYNSYYRYPGTPGFSYCD